MATSKKISKQVNLKTNLDNLSIKELKALSKRVQTEHDRIGEVFYKMEDDHFRKLDGLEQRFHEQHGPIQDKLDSLDMMLYDIETKMFEKENPPETCPNCKQHKPRRIRRQRK